MFELQISNTGFSSNGSALSSIDKMTYLMHISLLHYRNSKVNVYFIYNIVYSFLIFLSPGVVVLFVCFVCIFRHTREFFHSFGDVTIAGEVLQNLTYA